MKRAILIAIVGLCAAPFTVTARGGNNVMHDNGDSTYTQIPLASAGRCRHHLDAHPGDFVITTLGYVYDSAACN